MPVARLTGSAILIRIACKSTHILMISRILRCFAVGGTCQTALTGSPGALIMRQMPEHVARVYVELVAFQRASCVSQCEHVQRWRHRNQDAVSWRRRTSGLQGTHKHHEHHRQERLDVDDGHPRLQHAHLYTQKLRSGKWI